MQVAKTRHPDIVVTGLPEIVAEKIRLTAEANKRPPGVPSLCDELLEERRRGRIRDMEQEGW
jgi:hypothetical protein